jgi:hypothetical protein
LACDAGGADLREVGPGAIRLRCTGVFTRRGQVLDGQLKFAGFRRELLRRSVSQISIDVAMPCGPYLHSTFPKSWREWCLNGLVHRSATIDTRELPTDPLLIATGYRLRELAMIFVPLPLVVLLALALLAWINRAAAHAGHLDPRALWFSYVRAWSLGLAGLYVLWVVWWTAITGSVGIPLDIWALFSVWNGGSAWAGRLAALGVFAAAIGLLPWIATHRSPAAFAWLHEPRGRFVAGLKTLLLPVLRIILPVTVILLAVDAVATGQLMLVVLCLINACCGVGVVGIAIRSGRRQRTSILDGDSAGRIQAMSQQYKVKLAEVRTVPVHTAMIIEALEAEEDRVVFSDYVFDTLNPAERDVAVVRLWCMPMRNYPWVRSVLVFVAAVVGGALLSVVTLVALVIPLALLEGLFHVRFIPSASGTYAWPLALVLAMGLYRRVEKWMCRWADRRASKLLGDSELVTRVASKLAATTLPPWKWSRPPEPPPSTATSASPETAPA